MRRTARSSTIMAKIQAWPLSIAMVVCAVHVDTAQAQDSPRKNRAALALACGKALKDRCNGVSVSANNMLECLQKEQEKLPARCATLAHKVAHMCDKDAAQLCQGVVAGGGNILGCLTTAKIAVSSRCNAALDAVYLRQ
jgi:hypothetical protein